MNCIFKNIFALLLITSTFSYGQKSEIKEAQKELKAGNFEQALAILSPVEYLIRNADAEDRVNFYYIQGTALVKQANNHAGAFKNVSKAITVFSDLIQIESEANHIKFTPEAIKSLSEIKENIIISANNDLINENFTESSTKFYEAYLIDKKDTLQLYNAALSYNNGGDIDTALKCFEELKTIKYNGNKLLFIGYNKELMADEYFNTIEERDAKIQNGTHLRLGSKICSKQGDIYKNIALIYAKKGFKEKALKAIDGAKKYNRFDETLAVVEANLYLQTKDYETFDLLAATIIKLNPRKVQLAYEFGQNCQKESYYEGAESYYKKAIALEPQFTDAYINLAALLINQINTIDLKINNLSASITNKNLIQDLKLQKEELVKNVQPYLQKAVTIEPFNTNAKQLMASINMKTNIKHEGLASEE